MYRTDDIGNLPVSFAGYRHHRGRGAAAGLHDGSCVLAGPARRNAVAVGISERRRTALDDTAPAAHEWLTLDALELDRLKAGRLSSIAHDRRRLQRNGNTRPSLSVREARMRQQPRRGSEWARQRPPCGGTRDRVRHSSAMSPIALSKASDSSTAIDVAALGGVATAAKSVLMCPSRKGFGEGWARSICDRDCVTCGARRCVDDSRMLFTTPNQAAHLS
jgi:hypothetical protein